MAYSRALALGFVFFSFPDSDSPAHSSETSHLASRERTYSGSAGIDSRGWRRRLRVDEHARNAPSVIPARPEDSRRPLWADSSLKSVRWFLYISGYPLLEQKKSKTSLAAN